jgi:hypothetical protein
MASSKTKVLPFTVALIELSLNATTSSGLEQESIQSKDRNV